MNKELLLASKKLLRLSVDGEPFIGRKTVVSQDNFPLTLSHSISLVLSIQVIDSLQ